MRAPTVFSKQHPPVNRRIRPGLGVIDIIIRDAAREQRMDPNGAVVAAHRGTLDLAEPVGPSDISGQPGYAYETNEVTLVLTRDELHRLLLRNLRPSEYFKLVAEFGVFFETHDDFYDEDHGIAQQGSLSDAEHASFLHRCIRGEVPAEAIDGYVAQWHEGAGKGHTLHEFLGLTWAEYAQWVAEPTSLQSTLKALGRAGRDLAD